MCEGEREAESEAKRLGIVNVIFTSITTTTNIFGIVGPSVDIIIISLGILAQSLGVITSISCNFVFGWSSTTFWHCLI